MKVFSKHLSMRPGRLLNAMNLVLPDMSLNGPLGKVWEKQEAKEKEKENEKDKEEDEKDPIEEICSPDCPMCSDFQKASAKKDEKDEKDEEDPSEEIRNPKEEIRNPKEKEEDEKVEVPIEEICRRIRMRRRQPRT